MSYFHKYEHETIKTLLQEIKKGNLYVPIFQRDSVWDVKKIITFLNSLIRDEPFGYIILWETNKHIPTKNELFKQYEKKSTSNLSYIIDGQQRLTSLFLVFMCNEIIKNNTLRDDIKLKISNIYFDFDRKEFIFSRKKPDENSKSILDMIVPLDIDSLTWFEDKKEIFTKEWREVANKINNKILSIDVGKIILKNHDINDVIDIFNNFNTQGKKLTLYEVLSAKWYSANIEIEKFIDELLEEKKDIGLDRLEEIVLLDALFLIIEEKPIVAGNDKLDYDPKLNYEKITSSLEKFKRAFDSMCIFLKENDFNYKNLPSNLIIKWLIYFFYKLDHKYASNDQIILIKNYIALISINDHYSSSTTQKIINYDIPFIDALLKKDKDQLFNIFKELDKKTFNSKSIIDIKYNSKSMESRFITYILYSRSKDLRTSSKSHDLCEIDIHHLFPKNAKNSDGKRYKDIYEKINSICNIMPIKKETNNKDIKNLTPKQYYEKLSNDNKKIDKILEDSFIDVNCFRNEQFEDFINSRANKIYEHIKEKYLNWEQELK